MAMMQRQLSHLLTTFLLLMTAVMMVEQQLVSGQVMDRSCPVAETAQCRCHDNRITCDDIGYLQQMPRFNASTTVYTALSFHGDSRIARLQSAAFSGFRVQILDLSELGMISVDSRGLSGIDVVELVELNLANNWLELLPSRVFEGLTSLRVLDMRNNFFSELNVDIFVSLRSSLTTLRLSDNHLSSGGVPQGLLSGLQRLKQVDIEHNLLSSALSVTESITDLSLAGNRLVSVSTGTFDSLRQLRRLGLNSNDITSLDDGSFSNLTALEQLDLSSNRLTDVTSNSLEGLVSLRTLNLSENQLNAIAADALTSLGRLVTLDLSHNVIRRLRDGLPAHLTSLTTVNLAANNLSLAETSLRGLHSVTTLFLSHNNIPIVSSRLFTNLTRLRLLDLSHSKVERLELGLVAFSSTLRSINLAGNELREIQPGVFRNRPSLAEIDLSGNRLRRIERNSFSNIGLATVDLSHNKLEFVDSDAFVHIAALSSLALSHNRLTEVPSTLLYNAALLQNVQLDYNLIETIPPRTFQYLYLNDLSLGGNKIRTINYNSFEGLQDCKTINLSDNEIFHIDNDTFNYQPLSGVDTLDMSGNRLTLLTEPMFVGLSGLRSLNLSKNHISTIFSGTFQTLARLEILRLDSNQLIDVPANWLGEIPSLRTLNLSFSKFMDHSLATLTGLAGLRELYLDSNHLANLSCLPPFTQLRVLSVRNNSLRTVNHYNSATISALDLGRNQLDSAALSTGMRWFSNVTTLKLDANQLVAINADVFAPFADTLTELDVSHNQLNSSSLDALFSLSNLQHLSMDNNQIQDLSPLARLLPALRSFSLRHNRLNSTALSVLSHFTKLRGISLDDNEVEEVPPGVFQTTYNVEVLSMADNRLQTVDGNILYGLQHTCRHLDLSNNRISQAHNRSFAMLKSLEYLDLSQNNLPDIRLPPVMRRLKLLQLAGNHLNMFPSGPRRFTNINVLNFSRNSIVGLPDVAIFSSRRPPVGEIDFRGNNLLQINLLHLVGSFGLIDFSSNGIRDISPLTLARVKYIRQLGLSSNKILVISPTIWQTAFTVGELNLSNNGLLASVYNPFATDDEFYQPIIRTLNLSHNILREFQAGQISMLSSSLEVLDIHNNSFETLPGREFRNLTQLMSLFLEDNPWNCGCNLTWIRRMEAVRVDNAKCLVPFDVIGQLVICYTPVGHCQSFDQSNEIDARCGTHFTLTSSHMDSSTSLATTGQLKRTTGETSVTSQGEVPANLTSVSTDKSASTTTPVTVTSSRSSTVFQPTATVGTFTTVGEPSTLYIGTSSATVISSKPAFTVSDATSTRPTVRTSSDSTHSTGITTSAGSSLPTAVAGMDTSTEGTSVTSTSTPRHPRLSSQAITTDKFGSTLPSPVNGTAASLPSTKTSSTSTPGLPRPTSSTAPSTSTVTGPLPTPGISVTTRSDALDVSTPTMASTASSGSPSVSNQPTPGPGTSQQSSVVSIVLSETPGIVRTTTQSSTSSSSSQTTSTSATTRQVRSSALSQPSSPGPPSTVHYSQTPGVVTTTQSSLPSSPSSQTTGSGASSTSRSGSPTSPPRLTPGLPTTQSSSSGFPSTPGPERRSSMSSTSSRSVFSFSKVAPAISSSRTSSSSSAMVISSTVSTTPTVTDVSSPRNITDSIAAGDGNVTLTSTFSSSGPPATTRQTAFVSSTIISKSTADSSMSANSTALTTDHHTQLTPVNMTSAGGSNSTGTRSTAGSNTPRIVTQRGTTDEPMTSTTSSAHSQQSSATFVVQKVTSTLTTKLSSSSQSISGIIPSGDNTSTSLTSEPPASSSPSQTTAVTSAQTFNLSQSTTSSSTGNIASTTGLPQLTDGTNITISHRQTPVQDAANTNVAGSRSTMSSIVQFSDTSAPASSVSVSSSRSIAAVSSSKLTSIDRVQSTRTSSITSSTNFALQFNLTTSAPTPTSSVSSSSRLVPDNDITSLSVASNATSVPTVTSPTSASTSSADSPLDLSLVPPQSTPSNSFSSILTSNRLVPINDKTSASAPANDSTPSIVPSSPAVNLTTLSTPSVVSSTKMLTPGQPSSRSTSSVPSTPVLPATTSSRLSTQVPPRSLPVAGQQLRAQNSDNLTETDKVVIGVVFGVAGLLIMLAVIVGLVVYLNRQQARTDRYDMAVERTGADFNGNAPSSSHAASASPNIQTNV